MTAGNRTIATRYKIAQNIRSRRLKLGYTLKALADKTGIKYHTLLKYEQGACGIPTGELRKIANALPDKGRSLFPRRKVLKENNCFDKDRIQKIYDIMEKYTEAGERESRKAIYAVTQSIRVQKESDVKAARIRIAQNLLKAGFSVDIIYQATGLLTDEYDNKKKKTPKRQTEGREMKKWRIIQGDTQEDLAEKLGVSRTKIHNCEQENVIILGEFLWEAAEELPVDAEKLMLEPAKKDYYEDSGGENEQLSWSRECNKIDDQESLDELDARVEFLSQRRQAYKEKIYKVEAIKVANNLLRLGVSIDVIPQITGVSAAETKQLK